MRSLLKVLIITTAMFSLTGCGSFGKKLKSWLGGGTPAEEAQKKRPKRPMYSTNPNLPYNTKNRQYERTTKKSFEDAAKLESQRGSLWRMEGQESYLFSQNTLRLDGDILNVKLDGGPRKQLERKVQVINKLLERLKRAKRRSRRRIASAPPPKPKDGEARPQPRPRPAAAKGEEKEEEGLQVELVPVRIVDTLDNGNYRVRGMQTFMIQEREYRVIVTGIVKSGDIDDGIVSASRMHDSKFDIVSPRREVPL